jgi:26S proteasome subunit RPN7./Tetratricopeptide repeat.
MNDELKIKKLNNSPPTHHSLFSNSSLFTFHSSLHLIAFFALVLGACVMVNRADIKVKDEKVAQLVKEGAILYEEGKYEETLEKLSQAEKQARLREDKVEVATILSKGGFGLLEKRMFKMSLSYYERSLEINRTLDNKPGLINNYSYIGKIHADIGKYEEGIKYFEEALKIQKQLDDKSGIAANLVNVANLYSFLGNYQESIRLLSQALKISEEVRDPERSAKTLISLATIHFRLRNYQQSIEHLNRALEITDDSNDEYLKAYALNLIGAVSRSQGDYEKALDNYKIALTNKIKN